MEKDEILSNVTGKPLVELYEAVRTKVVTLFELVENDLADDQLGKIQEKRKGIIIPKVQDMQPEDIYNEIKYWRIKIEEFMATGYVSIQTKKKIIELQDTDDNATWEEAKDGGIMELKQYLFYFPRGMHNEEAQKKLEECIENERVRRRKEGNKRKMVEELQRDPNKYDPDSVRDIVDDLEDILPSFVIDKIDRACEVIANEKEKMKRSDTEKLYGAKPDSIPSGFTEVYFWGKPGSGKTCALAAILRAAEKRRMYRTVDSDNKSAGYMTYLKNKFAGKDGVGILPLPTRKDITRYLPFVLKKEEERKGHSVSLIELSGELFNCFALVRNGRESEIEADKKIAFEDLKGFLEDKRNKKIHFFFVEYGENEEPDDLGFVPQDYFDAAAQWFKSNKVFDNTIAIYLVLTKADRIGGKDEKETRNKTEEFFKEEGSCCGNFVSTLKEICAPKKKGGFNINGGELLAEPFSVGQVYLKYICKFDPSSANRIIGILLERIPEDAGSSLIDVLNR